MNAHDQESGARVAPRQELPRDTAAALPEHCKTDAPPARMDASSYERKIKMLHRDLSKLREHKRQLVAELAERDERIINLRAQVAYLEQSRRKGWLIR